MELDAAAPSLHTGMLYAMERGVNCLKNTFVGNRQMFHSEVPGVACTKVNDSF